MGISSNFNLIFLFQKESIVTEFQSFGMPFRSYSNSVVGQEEWWFGFALVQNLAYFAGQDQVHEYTRKLFPQAT
jgi:hypothetical protein